ncbi:zinc finger, GRF-type [Artemisia annua]|uniref:Zinc finger, GRF-type n=1 Tax=Artemisia annua TaxID=35608 RepID=A0A2U1MRB5_ARTAN|nr:zinc finger, GRF-type [Artemisia annua]
MVLCACGLQVVVRTSWTNRNPGRRFYSCPAYDALEDVLALEQERADFEEHMANKEETWANQVEFQEKMEEQRAKKLRKYLNISWDVSENN